MTIDQRQVMNDIEARRTYEEELLCGEATDTVVALRQSLSVAQKELARRLELSEGRISQIVSGSENITLRTLASLGWALGVRFELRPIPLADRAGTPGATDPPLPEWLGRLATSAPAISLTTVRLPDPTDLPGPRRPVPIIGGTPRAA